MARTTRASSGKDAEIDEEGLQGDGEEEEEEDSEGGEEEGSEEEEEEEDDDDDDDDDEDDDDEEEDDEVPIEESLAFGREKRATMGKRMGGLVGEELDKDETFWGDGKWNIDDAESEYSNESESGDEVDSDFSASEDEAGAGGDEEEDEEAERNLTAREKRQQQQETGARSKYKEPKRKTRPPPSGAAVAVAAAEAALLASMTPEEVEKLKEERKEAARLRREAALLAPVDRAKRATTQQKTVATQEALAKMAKEEARKPVVKAPRVSKCIFTQEEMLIEACKTEQENARWLLARKRMQNESDATAHAPKRQVKLAARFISRRGGYNVVNFPEVDLMPAILKGGEGGREQRRKRSRTEEGSEADVRKCVVTGLPAKYFDPLTRQPYANREAFKALRADSRYAPEEEGEEEDEDEGMDVVYEEEGGMEGGGGLRKGWSRSSSITSESFG
jgi:vacuolar protein sorting-associated protein 72